MLMRLGTPVVALLLGAGCFGADSLKSVTSGHIGCPEYEITIFNDNPGFNQRSWSARCRGRVYRCIGLAGGKYSAPHVSCKQDLAVRRNPLWTVRRPGSSAQPRARARAVAGCQYDTQCKGNRICKAGHCMAPSDAASSGPSTTGTVPRRRAAPAPPEDTSFAHRLGITLDDASKHVAAMGLKVSRGAVVLSARRGGAANRHRIQRGDVIVGLATTRVKGMDDVRRLNRQLARGKKFHIIVKRGRRIFAFYMRF